MIMKTEMAMLPNGNYESVISPIQHLCRSDDYVWICVQWGWKKGLFLEIEDGDPFEDGYASEIEIKHCPFCGYSVEG